jgi:hypothetical protein
MEVLKVLFCFSKDGATIDIKQYVFKCRAVILTWLYREDSDLDIPYTEVIFLLGYGVASLCSESDLSRQRNLMIIKVNNVH